VGGVTGSPTPGRVDRGKDEGVTSAPVFLYDGDCGFCSASARFIVRLLDRADRRGPRPRRPRVVPWQRVDLASLGVSAQECAAAVQWIERSHEGGRVVLAGPAAVARVLRAAGPGWRLIGRVLGTRPVTAAAWPAYRWISRHRHRLPGGTPACSRDRV
jgi:predicted DCC family thiol-disulfide oxidoreductase YuxK